MAKVQFDPLLNSLEFSDENPGGSGEVNTASNVGTAGVGLFKQKAGVDLELKKLNPASSKVTIIDDAGNSKIDIDVSVVKADVGLGNVDNTSDLNKPISTATQTALDAKGPTLRNVSNTTTFSAANETINCTSGTFIVNLPTAVLIQGTTYTLVNSGTGIITLKGNIGQTINGSLTINLTQYQSRTVQSDNANWIII